MEEAPESKKGRGRIVAAAAAGVAMVAIAVPVSGAFAEDSSSSSSQRGTSVQQATGFDDVQAGDSQGQKRDCPKKDGQRGGSSGSDSSLTDPGAGSPYDAQQL